MRPAQPAGIRLCRIEGVADPDIHLQNYMSIHDRAGSITCPPNLQMRWLAWHPRTSPTWGSHADGRACWVTRLVGLKCLHSSPTTYTVVGVVSLREMVVMGDESDLRAQMRVGVSASLRRLGRARRVSGVSLVALLCASALAPVVAAGIAVGPVMLAGIGVVGAVGADVLTDVIKGVVDHLRRDGKEMSQASVESALAARLEELLGNQGESAEALREAVAAVLHGVDAVNTLVEAAARDQSLLPVVMKGFTGIGERFNEFEFIVKDVRQAVWEIEASLRQQQAFLRSEHERAREHSLTLLQVLEAIEREGAGVARSHGKAANGDSLWSGCPYLGLVPFQEWEARIFYGRNELARQLMQRLRERLDRGGVLLLFGASGAGKSSLLRAGMMPRLAAGALGPGSERWPRRVIRPTGSPMRELAMHLADLAGLDPIWMFKSLSAAPDETSLLAARAVRTATDLGRDKSRSAPADNASLAPRLVLVIDQFEEVFTVGEPTDEGQSEREAFIAALHAAATMPVGPQGVPAALVVVAVRGDFLDSVVTYPPLAAAMDDGPFTVGPMTEAELRLTITGPAAEAGLTVEPALVEAAVSELRGDWAGAGLGTGVLPLISQAMAATWEHREADKLSLRGYRRAGGVADAVNRAAQEAYEILNSHQRDTARLVFNQLTAVTPDGQLTRRRCSRSELHASEPEATNDINEVIDVFSTRRLLVLGDNIVEISHDVLLHAWNQLRDWFEGDQLDRALYSQVVTDAQAWITSRRDPSYLYRSSRLAEIDAASERWAKNPTHYPPLSRTSEAFLRAAHRAARQTTRRRRAVIAGLAALTVSATTAAGFAIHNAAIASQQQAIALSRQLAAESLTIDPTNPMTARQLAVAAWRVSPTDQAASSMTNLLAEQQLNGILPADPSEVNDLAISPDGRLLASADSDGTVRIWNLATGQAHGPSLKADTALDGGVNGVAFSPNGKILASADADGTIRLWDPITGQPLGKPIQVDGIGSSGVNGVAFSPNGKMLASADSDGTIRLWDPVTSQPLGAAIVADLGSPNGVNGVAFSPNGKMLASADGDGKVRLWDPATGQPRLLGPPIRADNRFGVNGVAFSPNGKMLASADSDGTVRLWDPATGRHIGKVIRAGNAFYGGVLGVAFSPNGKLLASADGGGTLRLWNPATGQAPGKPMHADIKPGASVDGVAFSPNGKLLASADGDGTVRLWNPATGRAPGKSIQVGTGLGGGINEMAFSPNGKLLASSDSDRTVRLWNPVTGQSVGVPIQADNSPVFSRNGKLLAGIYRGLIRLWSAASGQLLYTLTLVDNNHIAVDLAFSPDSRLLASADLDGTIQVWNAATDQPVTLIQATTDYRGVSGVAFSPSGRLLASADGDGTIRLWNPATGQPVGEPLRTATAGSGVNGVAFSPNGKVLASANGDGTIRLWNPATGQSFGGPIQVGAGFSDGAYSVAFSPNGKVLASANGDGTIRLWNPATGEPLGGPLQVGTSGGATGVAFSPNGELLASINVDGTIRFWNVSVFADPYAALCTDVGGPTRQDWGKYASAGTQPKVCA